MTEKEKKGYEEEDIQTSEHEGEDEKEEEGLEVEDMVLMDWFLN